MNNEEFQTLVLKKLDKLDEIEIKLDENIEILRALEHKAEVNKSEHDKMNNDIAHIKGTIESIKKDMSTIEIVP